MDYAAAHGIPIEQTKKSPYSIDENLWGRAIECGAIEDPWAQPPADIWTMTRPPESGPPEPSEVVIRFEAGVPVALDGSALPVFELVTRLNEQVGAYGFGRIDMVENRRVGIKSRECYEAPGALALTLAHTDLEGVTLERDVMREKSRLEPRYAELVYDGLWHSPLRNALDAFMVSTQEHVTGDVRLRLEAGRCTVDGRRADRGLYDHGLATYDASDTFRHPTPRGSSACGACRWRRGPPPGRGTRRGGAAVSDSRRRARAARCGRAASPRVPPTELLDFCESLSFDSRLAVDDLAGSRAHVNMLARQGLITERGTVADRRRPRPGGDRDHHRHVHVPPARRGHPHRHRAAGHRAGRPGRGQAPHRPVPQRPGRPRPAPLRPP